MKYLNILYKNSNSNDIQIFRIKMRFLQLLRDKKVSDAQLLLWYIIHEISQDIYYILRKYIILPKSAENNTHLMLKNYNEKRHKFTLDILSKYNNVNNLKNKRYKDLSNDISKFFDINFLLKQLKILKILLKDITSSEEKKESLQRILNSIDVLIETCEETIYIVKNERNQNYNNYTRTRNPRNEF